MSKHHDATEGASTMTHRKVTSVRDKLEAWVKVNPKGYYKNTLRTIAAEAEVSEASVSRELPAIMARSEGVLPSAVMKKRQKAGFYRGSTVPLSPNQKKQITQLHSQGTEIIDIAYLVECSPQQVSRHIDKNAGTP